jgi:hypothetical protein
LATKTQDTTSVTNKYNNKYNWWQLAQVENKDEEIK